MRQERKRKRERRVAKLRRRRRRGRTWSLYPWARARWDAEQFAALRESECAKEKTRAGAPVPQGLRRETGRMAGGTSGAFGGVGQVVDPEDDVVAVVGVGE